VERYAVIDTNWDDGTDPLAGWTGHVLGRFNTLDSAKALVLQRMSFGDTGVMVVEVRSGARTYPPEESRFSTTPLPSRSGKTHG
jgi:hypothetical protein